jgi:hypothetical protein
MTALSVENPVENRQQARQRPLEIKLPARCPKTINSNAHHQHKCPAMLPDVAWLLPAAVSVARNSPSEGGGLCGRNGRKIKINIQGRRP